MYGKVKASAGKLVVFLEFLLNHERLILVEVAYCQKTSAMLFASERLQLASSESTASTP
jgi:hypothetical protein